MEDKTGFQIGENRNLFDWTYVGNVAHAHLLAADRLSVPPPSQPLGDFEKVPEEPPQLTNKEAEITGYRLAPITLTTGTTKVPTSVSRPLGPYVKPLPNAAQVEQAWKTEPITTPDYPITRTRFDQMSFPSLSTAKLHHPHITPLQVAGQVFFITNGEPVYFWDFPRLIWSYLYEIYPEKQHKQHAAPWILSRSTGMIIASLLETVAWVTGKKTVLTKFRVAYTCATRWHNIEKARRVLGYEPQVGVEEGMRRTMEVSSLLPAFVSEYSFECLCSGGKPMLSKSRFCLT